MLYGGCTIDNNEAQNDFFILHKESMEWVRVNDCVIEPDILQKGFDFSNADTYKNIVHDIWASGEERGG